MVPEGVNTSFVRVRVLMRPSLCASPRVRVDSVTTTTITAAVAGMTGIAVAVRSILVSFVYYDMCGEFSQAHVVCKSGEGES